MKISRTKFVLLFLLAGFSFLFLVNTLLGSSGPRLFPASAEVFLATGSASAWKSVLLTITYPVKILLVGPLLPLFNLPDPPPPFLVIAFAIYWAFIALVVYYIAGRFRNQKA